jgi:arabinofuranosyltransferase
MASRMRLWVLVATLIGAAQLLRFGSLRFAVDDAWISFRIARNWVLHGVPTFNPDRAPVEGMTNLFWTMGAALVYRVTGDDPILVARTVGAACFLGTVVAVAVGVGRQAKEQREQAAGVAALLVGSSGTMAYYALSGLESGLWVLLFTLALLTYAERGLGAVTGVLLGLLAATRPEGFAIGGLFCAHAIGTRRRDLAGMVALFALAAVVIEGFRWWTYDSLVPNTFHAKPPSLELGFDYGRRYLVEQLWLLGPLVVVTGLGAGVTGTLAATVALGVALGTVWSGGDWMPGFRRMDIATVCLVHLAGLGLGAASGWRRRLAGVGAVAILLGNVSLAFRGVDGVKFVNHRFQLLGHLLREQEQIEEIALYDIGHFGWAFDRTIFDLGGLVDARIASRPGAFGDKEWDEEYFREESPDVAIVLSSDLVEPGALPRCRPMEEAMLLSIAQHGGYHHRSSVEIVDGGYAHLYLRDGLMLPDDVFGAVPGPGIGRSKAPAGPW